MNGINGPLWQRAAGFAARAHRHQVRKDGVTPYFAHPCRVAVTVGVLFGETDEQALAAALLHDVIEDGETDYDELADEFGDLVAQVVSALSKDARLPESEREPAYDAQLARADWRARLIKLGDVYDNLSDLPTGPQRSPGAVEKVLARADRAIGLAVNAGDTAPSIHRGIEHLRALAALWRAQMP